MSIRSVLTLALALGLGGQALAGDEPLSRDFRRMSPGELDEWFAGGTACELPVGVTRGHVVHVADAKRPRLAAGLQNAFWKGKVFFPNGEFINRFCGFRADRSHGEIGPSWFDGKPCVVLEYPPSALVFANSRDEIREVAPGLYLARFYDRCPCPKFKGYFVLEMTCRD
jgi:hypothetical protein